MIFVCGIRDERSRYEVATAIKMKSEREDFGYMKPAMQNPFFPFL